MQKITATLCLVLITSLVSAQTKRLKIKAEGVKGVHEEVEVLKKDKSIREGSYALIVRGKDMVKGQYHNNQPIGKWFLRRPDHTDWIIDYDQGTIQYDTFSVKNEQRIVVNDKLVSNGTRSAISLLPNEAVLQYLVSLVRYPEIARENNYQGRIVVLVLLDEQGNITSYDIQAPAERSLAEEALRVIKLIPFRFIPAYKDGKAVPSEFKQPILFRLG